MNAISQCDYSLAGGQLSLDFPVLSVRNAAIGVTVLLGEDERPAEILFQNAHSKTGYTRNTPCGLACCARYSFSDKNGFSFDYVVGKLVDSSGLFVTATFHNHSSDSVRLRDIFLLKTGKNGVDIDGNNSDWMLMDPAHANKAADLSITLPSENERTVAMFAGFGLPIPYALSENEKLNDGHWRACHDYATLFTDQGKRGIAMGAVGVTADVDFDWWISDTCGLEVISKMSDVVVDPGESRDSETVAFVCGDYDSALPKILRWTASGAGARNHRGAASGWCSWYWKGPEITSEDCVGIAKASLKYEDRLHMNVVQIDDGFQRQVGDWDWNDSFADGISPFIDGANRANAIPGIWLAPLAVHDTVGGPNYTCEAGKILDVHPDWFQRNMSGSLEGEANNWGPKSHWLDPTHPGANAFIRRIIRRKREEGFRYFKIDFNTLGPNTRWHDPKKTCMQVYRDLYRLYREEIGEESYLLSCTQVTRGTLGFADASRIGPDSCSQWLAPHPCCIKECIRYTGATAHFNGIWYTNDPDVTYTNPCGTLTMDELRTWHSVVGLLGGIEMISDPLNHADYQNEEVFRMWEILTPQAPEKGVSLRPGVDIDHSRFGFVAHRPWEDFASVMLYNPCDDPADVSLDFPTISALGEKFHAWSFWDGKYLGIIDRSYVANNLAPHACVLLRLTALKNGPMLVGSDLHISMGASEIDNVFRSACSIKIGLNIGGAANGSLFVMSEKPLSIESCTGVEEFSISREEDSIWKISLKGRSREALQTVVLVADD